MSVVTLTDEQLKSLADLIAERLRDDDDEKRASVAAAPKSLLDAAGLAERLGCSRRWVYDHAEELGAVRLGSGPKAPLRFDLEAAKSAMARSGCEGSQAEKARIDGGSEHPGRRRPRRLPDRLPKPGLVLAVGGSGVAGADSYRSEQEAA